MSCFDEEDEKTKNMVGVRSPSSQGDAKKVDSDDATSKSDKCDDKGGGGRGRSAPQPGDGG